MYTAHYEGLTIFGGMHIWSILANDGPICQVVNSDKKRGEEEVRHILSLLNREI